MLKFLVAAAATLLATATPALADIVPLPASFAVKDIATNGTTLHVRVGGKGPAVLLIHGYGESGDMWGPLATALARNHQVIIPDLRGMGLSARAESGFDKKTQGVDMSGLLDSLKVGKVDVVAHDIGNMVAFAFISENPQRVGKVVLMDAPIPGVGPWDEILKSPMLWHFRFGGPDMERLVAGRERIYLDRFWNEFSADPAHFDEASRQHYAALYARPGAMHAGFAQFAAFDQDVIDNRAFMAKGKLSNPVLAIGGAKSFGPTMAAVAQGAFSNVQQSVIDGSGHWLMEEQPAATTAAIVAFLDAK
ncbi:pimeloyl-ACP methyl ester carboxylesterase [Novosphingobium sp. PhB165]|uniref:alpha/beta fold hydrolase n=1 Tax=Novosphingobium sp. PhB165 TaxID=2485105 RepID=UPI0010521C66|nr:alpha/beta hydrolase [Novosphingobium sp. PhB165]TCM20499.1 pimeloyl-ACP methyl ester carboxylesterase [Novosphingobium sp. PhB165]